MTLDEIKRLIEFIRAQELTEFELEQDGVKLRIKAGGPSQPPVHVMQALPVMAAPLPAVSAGAAVAVVPGSSDTAGQRPAPDTAGAPDAAEDEGPELAIVKSPIVGTFYRSPEPGAKTFVEAGDSVKKGQVLCIIEAMKLMNEIDSEYDGEIVSIYVENGQAVQYGERLFAIKLRT
jgi:acetyl-CoA carboxylase biotin carboxyl carrier protein